MKALTKRFLLTCLKEPRWGGPPGPRPAPVLTGESSNKAGDLIPNETTRVQH